LYLIYDLELLLIRTICLSIPITWTDLEQKRHKFTHTISDQISRWLSNYNRDQWIIISFCMVRLRFWTNRLDRERFNWCLIFTCRISRSISASSCKRSCSSSVACPCLLQMENAKEDGNSSKAFRFLSWFLLLISFSTRCIVLTFCCCILTLQLSCHCLP
jgi:hypothetical protein